MIIYIYIIARKKSASWQLVAVVEGPKTTQGSKSDVKLPKPAQNQRKNWPKWQMTFFVAVTIEIIYIYMYIFII